MFEKLLKHLTNAPIAVVLAFLLVGAPSAPGSLLLSPPAWADESDDDDEHDDVEEVVVTEEREDRSNHRAGGGTGQQTLQLLGSANYDYYGSVQCPLSRESASTAGPGCSCPEGMLKKETSAGGAWCEPREAATCSWDEFTQGLCVDSDGDGIPDAWHSIIQQIPSGPRQVKQDPTWVARDMCQMDAGPLKSALGALGQIRVNTCSMCIYYGAGSTKWSPNCDPYAPEPYCLVVHRESDSHTTRRRERYDCELVWPPGSEVNKK